MIFTDSSSLGKAAYATFTGKQCIQQTSYKSAQKVELYAILMVVQDFSDQPINLVSDSYYDH
jgi:hypothetical protein